MINPFFQNKGPFKIEMILSVIKAEKIFDNLDADIFDIKDLVSASTNEITFFHSKKYESMASTTKASYCLTTNKLSNILPKNCKPIEVDNVLVSTSIITSMFYPDAITDDFDIHTLNIEKTSFNNSVNHGQNILIGKKSYDIQLQMLAAMRLAIDIPIDIHTENPASTGGFIRHYEVPEMVRIASPIYLKTGGSVAKTHSWDTTEADAKQRAKQVRLVKRMLDQYYPEAVVSPK